MTTQKRTILDEQIERAYWHFDALHKGAPPYGQAGPQPERDAFKAAVRALLEGSPDQLGEEHAE